MRIGRAACIVVALGLAAVAPAYADVRVTWQDGRGAITATDATVAEILAEWGRVTHMTVVNADKLPRERVTIELHDVTEHEALDVLLRAMGGYIARRRIGAQSIDCVVVMAPSAPLPPQPSAATATGYAPAPAEDPNASSSTTAVASPISETVGEALPGLTQEEEAAAAVAQPAVRSRRALETVNPRDFVFPKKAGG